MENKFIKIKANIENEFNSLDDDVDFLDFVKDKSYEIIEYSGLFDSEFYLFKYPDVRLSNYDPIKHYLELGALESCNPNNQFNTQEYLNKHPKINPKLINPLVHFILFGFFEKENSNNSSIRNLEEKYFVSIIMVVNNDIDMVYSINSVLNQSFKNFELLISTPSEINLEDILKYRQDYSLMIDKIKYYITDDVELSKVRNKLLKEANGNVIAYLDSPNQWSSNFLEEILSHFNQNDNFACAYSNVRLINLLDNTKCFFNNKFNRKLLLEQNFIKLDSFVHLKQLYETLGGFDNYLSKLSDWDLIIRFTKNNSPIFVNNTFVDYYVEDINNDNQVEEENNLILNKFWTEKYCVEYEYIKDEFDQGYYLEKYEDVLKSNMHPILHFLHIGYKENRNPNIEFNMVDYKKKHSEICGMDINPFVHYIKERTNQRINDDLYNKYNQIINSNRVYLSNYSFNNKPLVSIIILNNHGFFYLKKLFYDFNKKTNYDNYEIIVIDSDLDDDSIEFLKSFDEKINFFKVDNNISFSKSNNDAIRLANGEYLLFLNSTIEMTYGWLNELMGTIVFNENIGAVGAKLLYPILTDKDTKYSLSLYHAGQLIQETMDEKNLYRLYNVDEFSKDIFNSHISKNKKCLSVSNHILLTKKELFKTLGGFNEQFTQSFASFDYNLRLYKENYKVILASSVLGFYHGDLQVKQSFDVNFNEIWSDFLFKRLLIDKISKNFFFTNKKLKFNLILNQDIEKDVKLRNIIHKLTLDLINHDYDVSINFDLNRMFIEEDVDILVSFSKEYDINNIKSRANLIKILILDDFIEITDYEWDVIGVINNNLLKELNGSFPNFPIFYISDDMELSKEIINVLMRMY